MKTKLSNKEISWAVSVLMLLQSVTFFYLGLIQAFKGNIDGWFQRCELSMILLGFYGVIKAIQSLKDK